MRCPYCDYDLRGTDATRCPECGQTQVLRVDRTILFETAIRCLGVWFLVCVLDRWFSAAVILVAGIDVSSGFVVDRVLSLLPEFGVGLLLAYGARRIATGMYGASNDEAARAQLIDVGCRVLGIWWLCSALAAAWDAIVFTLREPPFDIVEVSVALISTVPLFVFGGLAVAAPRTARKILCASP